MQTTGFPKAQGIFTRASTGKAKPRKILLTKTPCQLGH